MSDNDFDGVQWPVVQPKVASYEQALAIVSRMFCVFRV